MITPKCDSIDYRIADEIWPMFDEFPALESLYPFNSTDKEKVVYVMRLLQLALRSEDDL
jgi:hypothetical protein